MKLYRQPFRIFLIITAISWFHLEFACAEQPPEDKDNQSADERPNFSNIGEYYIIDQALFAEVSQLLTKSPISPPGTGINIDPRPWLRCLIFKDKNATEWFCVELLRKKDHIKVSSCKAQNDNADLGYFCISKGVYHSKSSESLCVNMIKKISDTTKGQSEKKALSK